MMDAAQAAEFARADLTAQTTFVKVAAILAALLAKPAAQVMVLAMRFAALTAVPVKLKASEFRAKKLAAAVPEAAMENA